MPNSVTNIWQGVFRDCGKLNDVTIPDGVSRILNWTFQGCTSLTNAVIPDSVTAIGGAVFADCDRLVSIVFNGDAPTVEAAFSSVGIGCTAYVKRGSTGWGVAIPGTWNGVRIEYLDDDEEDGDEEADYLVAIVDGMEWHYNIENGVAVITGIGTDVNGELVIPSTLGSGRQPVTTIGFGALMCTNITSLVIPETVTNIEAYAFAACISLKELTIPDSVQTIGHSAFISCIALEKVTVGSGLRDWNQPLYPIFDGCANVTEVVLCDGLSNIG